MAYKKDRIEKYMIEELEEKLMVPWHSSQVFADVCILMNEKYSGGMKLIEYRKIDSLYFDTPDDFFLKSRASLRLRVECGRLNAQLKLPKKMAESASGDGCSEGYFSRDELSILLTSELDEFYSHGRWNIKEYAAIPPDVSRITGAASSIIIPKTLTVTVRKILSVSEEICGFELCLDANKYYGVLNSSLAEIALDNEIEVELIAGCPDNVKALKREIAEKYSLAASLKSKYERSREYLENYVMK